MDLFVICPNCGATVPSRAKVESVRVDEKRLLISFQQVWADHVCEVDR